MCVYVMNCKQLTQFKSLKCRDDFIFLSGVVKSYGISIKCEKHEHQKQQKQSTHTHMIHKRKIATIKHTYKDFDLLCLYINVPLTESHTKFMSLMYDKVLASMFFMMASTTHNDVESEGKGTKKY